MLETVYVRIYTIFLIFTFWSNWQNVTDAIAHKSCVKSKTVSNTILIVFESSAVVSNIL